MSIFEKLFGSTPKVDLADIIKQGAFLVDVRSPAEFAGGNVKGSVNIPLDKVNSQLSKFKNKKTIVVFCQSGGRSGQAKTILEKNGLANVINGRTWNYVSQFVK